MLKKYIKNDTLRNFAEFAIAAAIAAAVFIVVWNFVARTGKVFGVSMEPTLSHGDIVLINRAAYYFHSPEYGDIIAFPSPRGSEGEYVKRVVGLPGDVVDYVQGVIYINGEELTDEYATDKGGGYSVEFPLTVPENCVFVLGDNRWASEDSRIKEIGCISIKNIMGKIVLRLFPFDKIKPF